jgi:hypothetical protein
MTFGAGPDQGMKQSAPASGETDCHLLPIGVVKFQQITDGYL